MAKIEGCDLIMKASEMEDRAAWLKLRNKGLGGSDAGIIVGVNPWKSPYQLWLEKTGQVEPENISEKEAVYWGTQLEDMVAREFMKRTGKKVQRHGMLESAAYPFLLANVDRLVVGEDAGLECKTTSAFKYKDWEGDNVPDSYYVQCQHYMMVTGLPRWYIAALIGGQHYVWKCIERNEDDIEALFAAEHVFWTKNVTCGIPPEVDGSVSCAEALREHFHGGDVEAVRLPRDIASEIESIHCFEEAKKNAEEEIRVRENHIKALMGDHEVAIYGDDEHTGGRITWKTRKGNTTIDTKRLRAERPDIFEQYKREGKPSRIFRFC